MKKWNQQLMSLAAMTVFMLMAAGSAKVNKIHCGAFNYYVPNVNDTGSNYIELNDGRKIYGKEIRWSAGLIVKDQIKIDGQKFQIRETRGYCIDGTYYGRVEEGYAKRFIAGKLNVYYTEDQMTLPVGNDRSGFRNTNDKQVCFHYVQVGNNGELIPILTQEDIVRFVKDCPKSVAMIDLKSREIRKALQRNINYLNDLFKVYNAGCK